MSLARRGKEILLHIVDATRDLSRVEHLNLSAVHLQRNAEQLRARDVLVRAGDVLLNLSDIEIKPSHVLIKLKYIEINPKAEDHIPPHIDLDLPSSTRGRQPRPKLEAARRGCAPFAASRTFCVYRASRLRV
jgi:hypothetical protein